MTGIAAALAAHLGLAPRIQGWRIWTVDTRTETMLRSPYIESRNTDRIGIAWTTTTMQASCEHAHVAPHPECDCGIYADPDDQFPATVRRTWKLALQSAHTAPHLSTVLGRVELAGLVLCDTSFRDPRTGQVFPEYRAEQSRITELWIPNYGLIPPPLTLADALTERYEVPVTGGLPTSDDVKSPQPVPAGIPHTRSRGLIVPADALGYLADRLTERKTSR